MLVCFALFDRLEHHPFWWPPATVVL